MRTYKESTILDYFSPSILIRARLGPLHLRTLNQ